MKKKIFVNGVIHPLVIQELEKEHEILFLPQNPSEQSAFISSIASEISVVLSGTSQPAVDKVFIDQFPNLKLIASFGVGYDHIDVVYAASKGILVSHTPDVLTDEVADLAIGLTLCVLRQLPQADRFVRDGLWETQKFPLSFSLRNRKVGIVGLGRIGAAIAKRFEAFGIEIAYHNRTKRPDVPYKYYETVKALAEACNLLVVAAPGGTETHHLINEDILKALGASGILINIARGSVVDENALIKALANKTIASAGLDVFTKEPHVPLALRDMKHIVLFPHIASASVETRDEMAKLVVNNVFVWEKTGKALTPTPETKHLN